MLDVIAPTAELAEEKSVLNFLEVFFNSFKQFFSLS